MSAQGPRPARTSGRPRSGLFLRIYLTFVTTVLTFTLLAGTAMWLLSHRYGPEYVDEIAAKVEAHNDLLVSQLADARGLARETAQVEDEVDAVVEVFSRVGRHRFGALVTGPTDLDHPSLAPHFAPRELHRLHRGEAVPLAGRFGPPLVVVPLFDEDHSRLVAVARVRPHRSGFRRLIAAGGVLFLLALAGGAWPLARSLTSRLARLEATSRRFATGDLSLRAPTSGSPGGDEIDQLAHAFNDMATRIDALLTGQRTLLANVSHELRTPISRMRVLVEILGERLTSLRESGHAPDPALTRLETGLVEMAEDIDEIERLIADLLTSGRLELGKDGIRELSRFAVTGLFDRLAHRYGATARCDAELEIEGDHLLLERMVSNLLANARRACPEGAVTLSCRREGDELLLEVEDEGPGVPVDQRVTVFDPFARLDRARARDAGGVGLGLYLCRQIARAHGGSIDVYDRRDGRAGARFAVRLPLVSPRASA